MSGGIDGVPRLHIASGPARASVVEAHVLIPGLLLVVAISLVIWLAVETFRRRFFLRRRFWRGAARGTISVIVFFAVLPAILPYDHIFMSDAHAVADDAVHESHCHVSPGSCTDAPLTSGLGQLLLSEPLAVAPSMLAVLLILPLLALRSISIKPAIRPPLLAG